LGGLWALPNVPGHLDEKEAVALAARWGAQPIELTMASSKKHIFTHVEWHMRGYTILCREKSVPFTWVSAAERAERVALPTAFRMFLPEE